MNISRLVTGFILGILFIIFSYSTSLAMYTANGSGISWGTQDANEFVTSVMFNTLGRQATARDFDVFNQLKGKKFEFFYHIIGSSEYLNRFAYLSRSYFIYFKPRAQKNKGSFCNCYYFAKNSDGLLPDMQYMGVGLPPGPQNGSVARALVEMCWTFDKQACSDYDCGKIAPQRETSLYKLGYRWDESESGWTGIWMRRDTSNVFDAIWTNRGNQEKAVLTISIHGNSINVKRIQSAGSHFPGQECSYIGTLAADNMTVTGTYGCDWSPGPHNWRATIRRDSDAK